MKSKCQQQERNLRNTVNWVNPDFFPPKCHTWITMWVKAKINQKKNNKPVKEGSVWLRILWKPDRMVLTPPCEDQNKESVIFFRAQLMIKSNKTRKKWSVWPAHIAKRHCGSCRALHPAGCETHDSEPPGLESQWREAAAPLCRSPGRAARHARTRPPPPQTHAAPQNPPSLLREQPHTQDQRHNKRLKHRHGNNRRAKPANTETHWQAMLLKQLRDLQAFPASALNTHLEGSS